MLIALVGASGCCMYRSATFAVTNSTGKDVRLSYVLARDCNALGSKVFMPRLVAADRVEAGGDSAGTPASYTCDPRTKQVSFVLLAGQGVALYRDIVERGCTSGPSNPVESLSVENSGGSLAASGRHVRALFNRRSAEFYVLDLVHP